MRIHSWFNAALAFLLLSLAGCIPFGVSSNGPAQVAQSYVGKPLIDLESQLGAPDEERFSNDERLSTWEFDRCSVTATTNGEGIVADVSWTRGCAAL